MAACIANYLVLLLTPLVVSLFWFRLKRLNFQRDFLFFVFLAMMFIYLHLVPILNVPSLESRLAWIYFWIQLACVSLLEIPLIVLYLRGVSGRSWPQIRKLQGAAFRPSFFQVLSLAMVILGGAIAFLHVSLEYSLFFRRIGHEGLARRSFEIPFLNLVFYRAYAESGVFAILSLLFLLSRRSVLDKWSQRLVWATLAIHSLVYGVYVLINNRFQVAILIVSCFAACCYWFGSPKKIQVFTLIRIVFLMFLLLAGMKIVTRSRIASDIMIFEQDQAGQTFRFNFVRFSQLMAHMPDELPGPMSEVVKGADSEGSLRDRLNGIDLMARITDPALTRGFLWGRAWVTPIGLYVYRFTNPEKYREIKLGMKTNPKVMIADHYIKLGKPDYASSFLTDLYGNFFVFGLPLAAVFLGLVWAFVTQSITLATSSIYRVLAAVYWLPFLLYLEKEFITYLLSPLKFSIALILLLLIFNPRFQRILVSPIFFVRRWS